MPIPAAEQGFAFVGQPASITINNTQRVTTTLSAALATSSGTANFRFNVCYQLQPSGIVSEFTGGGFMSLSATTLRSTFAASQSRVIGSAGTYKVGLCIWNYGATAIDSNDYLFGWVMVTN
jgi:hypothetical protein